VETAIKSADNTNHALYFWDPNVAKSEYLSSLTVVKVIGDHNFGIE
jgi:spore germination cell wall hydrolase CwlJ-like protein